MLFRDNGYIEGRIHEAGSPWVNTMVDERYTPPEGLRMTEEKLWEPDVKRQADARRTAQDIQQHVQHRGQGTVEGSMTWQ